eukprot:CAMPEP_0170570550 /NCGR_PEP_ID=MMETSP0224-20130122/1175_1 /TAXON_ID=285029 /ORGANISM="Togula jolla, Strain CCCM 725" /LENGTH=33 /DNA_ID= /DNA_START= /DNA_END= /DNA_ORIENTATION=
MTSSTEKSSLTALDSSSWKSVLMAGTRPQSIKP